MQLIDVEDRFGRIVEVHRAVGDERARFLGAAIPHVHRRSEVELAADESRTE